MGKDTNIQWADTTVNPTTGCDGCELYVVGKGGPCYAGVLHEGRLARSLPVLYGEQFTEVRLAPGRMAKAAALPDLAGQVRANKPWLDGQPRTVFIGDMGDVLSLDVPFDYLRSEVVDVVRSPRGLRHRWMLLTKRPNRLVEFANWLHLNHGIDWPANLWAGTSVTGVATLKRILSLLAMPAGATLFASLEPLWESVDLTSIPNGTLYRVDALRGRARGTVTRDVVPTNRLRQVIVGGESRQGGHTPHRFDVDWVRDLIGQCRAAGTAVFVKQLGAHAIDERNGIAGAYLPVGGDAPPVRRLRDPHGGDWEEWPRDVQHREFPTMEVARA